MEEENNHMQIELDELEQYFEEYLRKYRDEFKKFVAPPPAGPGYPDLPVSPYLQDSKFDVYLADNGVIINQDGLEPEYQWYVAGGPALKVDYEPSVTPKEITDALQKAGILGKPIGIYRIVSKKTLPNKIWKSRIDGVSKSFSKKYDYSGVEVRFNKVATTVEELLSTLTFGAFGPILDIHLPTESSDIGAPHVIRNIGVFPADLNNRRFINYMEVYGQSDRCAWDMRAISLRVRSDIRRDLSRALSMSSEEGGGTLSLGATDGWIENYNRKLSKLKDAITAMSEVLLYRDQDTEDVFHNVLVEHPILLDVYGIPESKPRLRYPDGETSIIGKTYVEPDFIIKYPDQSYKLVELERASKGMATKEGHTKADLTQAAFQIAEWRHYIKSHYQLLKDRYPGIQSKCKSMIVMSRSRQKQFGGLENQKQYAELIHEQLNVDEVITYDDLLERASFAYFQLTGLSPNSI